MEATTLETAALSHALDNDALSLSLTVKKMLRGERVVLIKACERLIVMLEQANKESP